MSKTIVQVTRRYWPDLGGVETHVFEMNRELIKQGWSVTVIVEQTDTAQPLLDKGPLGERIFRLPLARKLKVNKVFIWSKIFELDYVFYPAQIVQVHDVGWWLLPVWGSIRRKLFVTFHGWEGQWPIPLRFKLHRRLVAKLAAGTIHVGGWIQELYGDQPSAVVYGGVSDERLETAGVDLKALETRSRRTVLPITQRGTLEVVFLGRLEPENDVWLYLKLAESLQKEGYKLAVTWVGDGSLAEACAKLGQVVGMSSTPLRYVQKADVVWASSYLSIIEAQRLGKVVCAFYSNELKEKYLGIFPGAEYMILANTNKLMKERIIAILNTKNTYQKMSNDARYFAESMSWEKVVSTYKSVWKSV